MVEALVKVAAVLTFTQSQNRLAVACGSSPILSPPVSTINRSLAQAVLTSCRDQTPPAPPGRRRPPHLRRAVFAARDHHPAPPAGIPRARRRPPRRGPLCPPRPASRP